MVIELIDRAAGHLDAVDGDPHENIHEARKRFKETRAALKLFRSGLDAYYPFENVFYRDAGRSLSAARDAKAIIESLEKLEKRYQVETDVSGIASARHVLEERLDANAELGPVREVRSALSEARERARLWPLRGRSFDALEEGLRSTYAAGRKAFHRSYDDPTAENFHEWRKRVKDHWYHSQILYGLWPDLMKGYIGTMKELSQILGDDHDLVVVRDVLLAEPEAFGGDVTVFAMLQMIDRRRSELEDAARTIGSRIYAEKPGVWIERMRALWEASSSVGSEI